MSKLFNLRISNTFLFCLSKGLRSTKKFPVNISLSPRMDFLRDIESISRKLTTATKYVVLYAMPFASIKARRLQYDI